MTPDKPLTQASRPCEAVAQAGSDSWTDDAVPGI